jgi:hypothetical protein
MLQIPAANPLDKVAPSAPVLTSERAAILLVQVGSSQQRQSGQAP